MIGQGPTAPPPATVTLLTQPDCALCEHAKDVLARVAADHPFIVTEVDLGGPAGRDLAMRHRVLFAPGILIDGQPFSYGRLSEKKLRRHLARPRRIASPIGQADNT
jgi:hypothetical protein